VLHATHLSRDAPLTRRTSQAEVHGTTSGAVQHVQAWGVLHCRHSQARRCCLSTWWRSPSVTDFEIFIQGIMMRIAFASMVNCACVCVRVQLVRVYASVCSLSHASGRRQVCVRVQLVSKGQRPDAVKCGATWGRRQHSQERLKSEGTQAPAAASGRKVSARRKM
jgi:hypothetical protein